MFSHSLTLEIWKVRILRQEWEFFVSFFTFKTLNQPFLHIDVSKHCLQPNAFFMFSCEELSELSLFFGVFNRKISVNKPSKSCNSVSPSCIPPFFRKVRQIWLQRLNTCKCLIEHTELGTWLKPRVLGLLVLLVYYFWKVVTRLGYHRVYLMLQLRYVENHCCYWSCRINRQGQTTYCASHNKI